MIVAVVVDRARLLLLSRRRMPEMKRDPRHCLHRRLPQKKILGVQRAMQVKSVSD